MQRTHLFCKSPLFFSFKVKINNPFKYRLLTLIAILCYQGISAQIGSGNECVDDGPFTCDSATATVILLQNHDTDFSSNIFDLDDDNDGIPDTTEFCNFQHVIPSITGSVITVDGAPVTVTTQITSGSGEVPQVTNPYSANDGVFMGVTTTPILLLATTARLTFSQPVYIVDLDFFNVTDGNDGIAYEIITIDLNGTLTNANHLELADTNGGIAHTPEQAGNTTDGLRIVNQNLIAGTINNAPESSGTIRVINPSGFTTLDVHLDMTGISDGITFITYVPECQNFDGDLRPDYVDIDSDNDGIPDNVEAQQTATYIPPSGTGNSITDVNNNGLDDNYDPAVGGINIVPVNTDALATTSDTNPDYRDTDSDNDGATDDIEGGFSGILSNSDGDGDGLDDSYDLNPGLRDVNDEINDPNPSSLLDSDGDLAADGNNAIPLLNDLDYRDNSLPDHDVDGSPDSIDIDNDNDGILDAVEDDNTDGDNDPATNPTDTDTDGIPNYLDIDSDNDGIPDNIEAQTTSGYIAPAGIDTDLDGLDDNYEGTGDEGLTPQNSDGTDVEDYLDTDTDNDGILDIAENGDSDITLAGTDADNDGMDDNFDSTDDSVGTFTPNDNRLPTAANYGDTDGDAGLGGDLDYRDMPSGDTDADGIDDAADLDDDNDGITDETEYCAFVNVTSSSTGSNVTIDGQNLQVNNQISSGLGQIPYTGNTVTADSAVLMGNTTTPSGSVTAIINFDRTIYVADIDIFDLTDATDGTHADVLNIEIDGLPANGNQLELPAAGAISHIPELIGSANDGLQIINTHEIVGITGGTAQNNGTVRIVKRGGFTNITLRLSMSPDGDGIGYALYLPICQNMDNDNYPDFIDIDSDNDGIPDNIEAQPTAGYIAPGGAGVGITDTNNNGLNDIYESTLGGTDLVPVNTDSLTATTDLLPDYRDSDSDNDGISDTVEAGYLISTVLADADGDGLLNAWDDSNDSGLPFDVNDDIDDPNPSTLSDSDTDLDVDGENASPPNTDLDYRDDFFGSIDLEITKTVSETETQIGNLVTFTVTLANISTQQATNISVEDQLPGGYRLSAVTTTTGTYNEVTGIWTVDFIDPNSIETLQMEVEVLSEPDYENVATIVAVDQIDAFPNNDSATASTNPPCLTIYNEFSPNDDGINDIFYIDCIEQYPNNTLKVYNRWGIRVYSTNGYANNWDGTSMGRATINANDKLPVGTYFYLLDLGNGLKELRGWLYINR